LAILEQINNQIKKRRKKCIKISSYLNVNLVSFLTVNSRYEAISFLVSNLGERNNFVDGKVFHRAIINREKIVSTGIGMGVAIPHAKLSSLNEFFISIGIQQNRGIDWDSIDGASVRLVFMIGGPDNRQDEYLQILSRLTLIIKDEALRKKLINAENEEEVIDLLSVF
jgi:PTS system nitrogen regulatory IIA component